jgi:hypothetical protein
MKESMQFAVVAKETNRWENDSIVISASTCRRKELEALYIRYVSTMTRNRYPGVWQVSKGHYYITTAAGSKRRAMSL